MVLVADSKLTPVAKDADATVEELHARAAEDYRYGQDYRERTANEHARAAGQGG